MSDSYLNVPPTLDSVDITQDAKSPPSDTEPTPKRSRSEDELNLSVAGHDWELLEPLPVQAGDDEPEVVKWSPVVSSSTGILLSNVASEKYTTYRFRIGNYSDAMTVMLRPVETVSASGVLAGPENDDDRYLVRCGLEGAAANSGPLEGSIYPNGAEAKLEISVASIRAGIEPILIFADWTDQVNGFPFRAWAINLMGLQRGQPVRKWLLS